MNRYDFWIFNYASLLLAAFGFWEKEDGLPCVGRLLSLLDVPDLISIPLSGSE